MKNVVADSGVAGSNRLNRRAAAGRPLLACYFSMGDPLFDDAMRDIYAQSGVDILELGIPTPDPYLDGPDVGNAMARALAGPFDPYRRMAETVAWIAADPDRPAGVCMAYPDLDIGRIDIATLDGLDGFLIIGRDGRADNRQIDRLSADHSIRDCGLVPLHFGDGEAADAARFDGYVMLQAAAGVTGPRAMLDPALGDAIARLRTAKMNSPILAGFGIGTAQQAREAIDLGADGVVIGSMCVRKVLEGPDAIRSFLQEVRSSLDA